MVKTGIAPPPQPALPLGQEIPFTIGSTTIRVQYVRAGAYAVTVYQGPTRVDELCSSYPTEHLARTVARGYAHLYRAEAAA